MRKYGESDMECLIPVHKMGFKILRETQLKNMFPTYENLFEKIDIHREFIKRLKAVDRKQMDYQYNLMYDTVFSIFGSRGSGKTSAVFTLKSMIEKRYKEQGDVVLPIIMPEMIPDHCDIISWILAIIEQVVLQIEDGLQKQAAIQHQVEDDGEYFYNCRFKKDNKLRQEYNRVKELYFSKEYSLHQSESFYAAIGDSEMQIQNGYKFSKAFTSFWTTLKEAIEKTQGNAEEIEPLIYLIFDDVDLTPNKVVEMLAAIVKYLSHPNLVVIVTADEELFNEVVENSLRKKLGYDENQGRGIFTIPKYFNDAYDEFVLNEALERKRHLKKTARLYLDKILPPSSRYYINTFDTCLKRRRFIERVERQREKDTIIDTEALLQTEINEFIEERTGEKPERYASFLYYKADSSKFISTYLLFWGETSRQLANQCFLVTELISSLKKIHRYYKEIALSGNRLNADLWEQMRKDVYQQFYHYLYNAINSSGNFELDADEISSIVNHIWQFERDQWPLYVDYHYLHEYFEHKERKTQPETTEQLLKLVRFIFGLYTILFFVENLLYIWDAKKDMLTINKGRRKIHGRKDLVNFFDRISINGISLVRNSTTEGVERLLYLYGWMMEKPEIIHNFDVVNYSLVKNYLYMLQAEERECTKESLKRWSKYNPIWFSTMVQATHLAYRGIYLLWKKDIHSMLMDDRLNAYDTFVQRKKEQFRRIIIKYFTDVHSIPLGRLKDEITTFYALAPCLINCEIKAIEDNSDKYYTLADMEKSLANQLALELEPKLAALNKFSRENITNPVKYFMAYLVKNYPEIVPKPEIWNEKDHFMLLDAAIEQIKMELHTIHKNWGYYFVQNTEEFWDGLEKIKMYADPHDIDMITRWGEVVKENKKSHLEIAKEALDSVLSLKDVPQKLLWLDEAQKEKLGMAASAGRIQVMGSLELLITNQRLAAKYITLWEAFQFFLPYYIASLVKHREKAMLSESFQDLKFIEGSQKKETFSYAFFKAVNALLQQDKITESDKDGTSIDHIKSLLHSRIEQAGHRYYQYIMEGKNE